MYRANFANRYAIGKASEEAILPTIIKYFAREIVPTIKKTDKFDYKCEQYNYELKTRTNKMNAYSTTMICSNKLETNSVLLFKFTDKLCYINYDAERFANYETKFFTMYDHPTSHTYIPVKDLIIIE
jgi:hypothetical protein